MASSGWHDPERSRHLYEGRRKSLAFRDCIEGLLSANAGDFERAETLLRSVWKYYRRYRSWDWRIAGTALEIAGLYAQYGRQAELREFAREMTPVLFCRGLHREAVTALGHLLRAIQFEAVGAETIRAVDLYIQGSRFYPELKFPWA